MNVNFSELQCVCMDRSLPYCHFYGGHSKQSCNEDDCPLNKDGKQPKIAAQNQATEQASVADLTANGACINYNRDTGRCKGNGEFCCGTYK